MMTFPRGAWRYTVLVVLLLAIAGLAARSTINYIEGLIATAASQPPEALQLAAKVVHLAIFSMTLGFLTLAGALGLWAIRSTTRVESQRRVGRFVDAMDYLRDGVLILDHRGNVTGWNPAARTLSGNTTTAPSNLRALFSCLTGEDAILLLDAVVPQEVERVSRDNSGLRALRFRTQPSEDMILVLVSDVTNRKAQEMRERQAAQLHLIGRIARGVAHDFNNILCAISGYAALLNRQKPGAQVDQAASTKAIMQAAQRGASLAGQLLDLSRMTVSSQPCTRVAEHIQKAADLLRVGLPSGWHVTTDTQGLFASVPLTNTQVEQLILSTALLVADERHEPGLMRIRARLPGADRFFDGGPEYAVVLLIDAQDFNRDLLEPTLQESSSTTAGESGVIPSVVRSILEEVHGRLDVLLLPNSRHCYRLCLPRLSETDNPSLPGIQFVESDQQPYMANWRALLALPVGNDRKDLLRLLDHVGMKVTSTDDIVSALQNVSPGHDLSVMVFDKRILGDEADPLLRAIVKLQPSAGVVVLCDAGAQLPPALEGQVVIEATNASPDTILRAMIHARELPQKRSVPTA